MSKPTADSLLAAARSAPAPDTIPWPLIGPAVDACRLKGFTWRQVWQFLADNGVTLPESRFNTFRQSACRRANSAKKRLAK